MAMIARSRRMILAALFSCSAESRWSLLNREDSYGCATKTMRGGCESSTVGKSCPLPLEHTSAFSWQSLAASSSAVVTGEVKLPQCLRDRAEDFHGASGTHLRWKRGCGALWPCIGGTRRGVLIGCGTRRAWCQGNRKSTSRIRLACPSSPRGLADPGTILRART